MRPPENLSGDAKQIVDDVKSHSVSINALISLYESWSAEDHPLASAAVTGDALEPLSERVRQQLGLTHETSERLEALGDAIDVLLHDGPDDLRQRWHEAKVKALESNDEDKRRIVLRHLDSADYDDDLVVAALIESLSRDGEDMALLFGVITGMLVDPSSRSDVVQVLLDELIAFERRGSSRAALFGSALEQMYQNHAYATPVTTLIEALADIVTGSPDPASYAATVDIVALAIHRSHDVALIEDWLKSVSGRRRILAVAVVHAVGLSSLGIIERRRLCTALTESLDAVASPRLGLTPRETTWLASAIRAELAECERERTVQHEA